MADNSSDGTDEELFGEGDEEEEINITDDAGGEEEEAEEEDSEQAEEDKEPEPEPNPLTADMMRDSLSMLSPIGGGLAHAYVRIDVRNRDLTDVSVLQNYIHLRYVILSNNLVKDVSALSHVTNLLTLRADNNRVSSVQLETMPYLQLASFSRNKIKTMEGLAHPLLEKLYLSYNQIERLSGLDPVRMASLTTLDLRANRLEVIGGEFPPKLRELYLPGNLLRRVEGIEKLAHLAILHLRDNLIENLDGFSPNMNSLQYINLRGNQVASLEEVEKLRGLPQLRALTLSDNPVSEEEDYRLEVLVTLEMPCTLERLDKDQYEQDERAEARELLQQRKEDQAAEAVEPDTHVASEQEFTQAVEAATQVASEPEVEPREDGEGGRD